MKMPKETIKIIVTSAGTASAISVIKALKLQNEFDVRIIAVDSDKLAAGLYLADEFVIIPHASSNEYIPTLIAISKATQTSILIPIYSKEIEIISRNSDLLKENGIQTILSDADSIIACNDKKRMCEFAIHAKLKVPHIYNLEELKKVADSEFPIFVRPIHGSSSVGAQSIENSVQLNEKLNSSEELIFQKFINAEEVTVDVLCDKNSNPIVIAPRLRLATKSGQSVKARSLDRKIFQKPVEDLCKLMSIKGACNIQFFVKEEILYFIELNPRFAAGGLMLTVIAGANIPLLLVKLILNLPIKTEECLTKVNYVMSRYWEEVILDEHGKII